MNIHELIRPDKRAWRRLREKPDPHAIREGYNRLGFQVSSDGAEERARVALELATLPLGLAARVVDAGCGAGGFCRALKQAGFTNITAFDVADAHVDAVRPYADRAFLSSCEAISADDASFDVIACLTVIEHCLNPSRALRELHRVLAPGGYLYLTTDNAWWQTITALRRPITSPSRRYQRLVQPIDDDYSTWQMRRMLEAAGFEICQLEGIGGTPVLDRQFEKWLGCPTRLHPILRHFTTRMAFLARRSPAEAR